MNMNPSYIQTVYDETIKTVSVVFDLDDIIMTKQYTYKTRLELSEGDVCVVNTPTGLKIVQVVEVHEEPRIDPHDRFEYKWISHRVDTEAIEKAEAEDKAFTDKARKFVRQKARESAKAQLDGVFGDLFLSDAEKAVRKLKEDSENVHPQGK